MKYTLVKPDGSIDQSREFSGAAHTLAPNKGRWIPDNPPAYNPATHDRTRTEPVSAQAVEIPYAVTPRDPAVIAAEQAAAAEMAAQETAKATAKADAFVRTFIAMTPDEVASYVNGNVTDLASARVLLRRMALMMLYLAKQAYK
jgi:hypothetical protein